VPGEHPGDAEYGEGHGEGLVLAGGAPDDERAVGVAGGVGEAVQVELGPGEVDDCIQLAGELCIREPVDESGGPVTDGTGELRGAGEGEAAGRGRRAGGLQQGVAHVIGEGHGAFGPAAHGRVVHAVQTVERESIDQREGLRRLLVRDALVGL